MQKSISKFVPIHSEENNSNSDLKTNVNEESVEDLRQKVNILNTFPYHGRVCFKGSQLTLLLNVMNSRIDNRIDMSGK